MPKYRSGIKRSSKKKKPPGRWGNVVNNDETIVNNDETIVNNDETIVNINIDITVESTSTPVVEDVSTCSKKLKLDEQYIREKTLSTVKNKLEWCSLLLDTSVLNDIVDTIGACPSCSEKMSRKDLHIL